MVAGLASLAHCLPERVISSEELSVRFVDADGDRVLGRGVLERLTGVRTRRWVVPGVCSSDLASRATTSALEKAALDPASVDLLIFAAASHDLAEPATANRVQELTGCVNARVLDVKNACNSFLDGVDVATAMIATGVATRAVVATGEVISPFVETTVGPDGDPSELVAGLTLGDAAAAAVVTAADERSVATVGRGSFLSIGEHWNVSRIMAGGSMTGRDFSTAHFVSDSQAILKLAVEHVPAVARRALEGCGWQPADVDLVVPHQASVTVIRRIAQILGIAPERCVITAPELGNTAAASIPVALSMALDEGRLADGDRVLLVGGAAGFSAAAMPLTIGPR